MESELVAGVVGHNQFLASLAGHYAPRQIQEACLHVLGFPIELVTREAEAVQVAGYLRDTN